MTIRQYYSIAKAYRKYNEKMYSTDNNLFRKSKEDEMNLIKCMLIK